MSTLPTRSHGAIVSTIAAGMQGRIARFLNFATGGVFLALAEAFAGVCLWLQRLILQVQSETRLATSRGADVDSYVADFGLARLPAIAASGVVTFSRYTAGNVEALIPVDARVRTTDGSLEFAVVADSDVTAFDNARGAYIVPPGVAQLAVPVAATVLGTAGNVGTGGITRIASDVRGMDTVANLAPIGNGVDAETDNAVRARFVLFLASLSKATVTAIKSAVHNLRQGLQVTVVENKNLDGTPNPGFFYVVVDDGTGNPPDEIISAAYDAIDVTRGASVRFAVFRPSLVYANVEGAVTAKPGYDLADIIAAVGPAWARYVNELGLGETLLWGKLYQLAYDAHPGVATVSGVTVNAVAADLVATPLQTIRTNLVSVS